MPFCTQCGHEASPTDAFCSRCGATQPGRGGAFRAAPPPPLQDPLAGMSPRTAGILCYVPAIGWIAAVIVLATRRFKQDRIVRFHAFQGLYLFAAWLIVDWGVGPIVRWTPGHHLPLDTMLRGLILAVCIFMMIKASHDEAYVLPIIGELAQRSATEQ